MAGGIIQLAAYGIQDVYLTGDPQITFFKIIYRRHTNFAMESIPQYFDKKASFGETVTCTLSRNGDLAYRTYLYVTLPTVPRFYNQTTNSFDDTVQFAWAKNIGYAMIKTMDIEIGGQRIDKQYGEWLHIWNEVSGNKTDRGLDLMIGNIPDLYEFSTSKSKYTLFIPLNFWFCRNNGLSLPLIGLQFNEVKINIQFRNANECYIVVPSHQYEIVEDICSFTKGDIIKQTQNGTTIENYFIENDPISKTIKYLKINNLSNSFTSATILKSSFRNSNGVINNTEYNSAVANPDSGQNLSYRINNGINYCTPAPNKKETALSYYSNTQFSFIQAFLLVDYIYLDNDERLRFARSNHEYLIEQIQIAADETITSNNVSLKLSLNHPCKSIYWVCQLDYFRHPILNDRFNYTTVYKNGESLIRKSVLLLNGQQRFAEREANYFNWVQPYQHHSNSPNSGINCYSFSIFPEQGQPSGTCNMSRIDNINLTLTLNTVINPSNTASIRVYAINYNVLRILHGLGGVAFIN